MYVHVELPTHDVSTFMKEEFATVSAEKNSSTSLVSRPWVEVWERGYSSTYLTFARDIAIVVSLKIQAGSEEL